MEIDNNGLPAENNDIMYLDGVLTRYEGIGIDPIIKVSDY